MHENQELIEKNMNLKEILKKSKNCLNEKIPDRISIITEIITPNTDLCPDTPIDIIYGINETPFGKVLIAVTDKGICDLRFITKTEKFSLQKLFSKWSKANFTRDDSGTAKLVENIFYSKENATKLNLHLRGTDFQLKVWKELLKIPKGCILSYSDIAELIKYPKANRVVGTAIGQNPIHYIIPCHRIIKSNGDIGEYAAGTARKKALLESEIGKFSA